MPQTINPANFTLLPEHWQGLGPILLLTVGILLSMLLATVSFRGRIGKLPLFLFSALVVVAAGAWTGLFWVREPMAVFGGLIQLDYFSSFFNALLLGATLLVMLSSYSYLEESHIHYSEFYPILLSSTLGMMLLAASAELLTIFVSLELMSLMVYVLVGIRRRSAFSNEASVKYFLLGGASSAIFLYGIALIYGALATTKLSAISAILAGAGGAAALANPVLIAGIVLLLVGFLFKIAAVPFHMWTPDVYEGAPANITSYMATAVKAAVFAAFVRVSASLFGNSGVIHLGDLQGVIHGALWVLALLTMVVGNFVALMQTNLKRLMAYSAIAHTGYLLVGILAGPTTGYAGIAFYLVAYIAMNIGTFALLNLFAGKEDGALTVPGLVGLGKRHPVAAAALTIFLLSLGGFPPTAGFVAKYYLFTNALAAGETVLVLIAVLTSAVSVYYYLRLVVMMYMKEGTEQPTFRGSAFAYAAIAICVILTLNYGIFPGALMHAVQKAAVF
jgi:NADH-quinone oxidoreductase subunit N